MVQHTSTISGRPQSGSPYLQRGRRLRKAQNKHARNAALLTGSTVLAVSLSLALGVLSPSTAKACGGFFCATSPIDQSAERVVFAVGEDETQMIVQINYQGDAEDFAWVVPIADVPDPDSLDTFPQNALIRLDQITAPSFVPASACFSRASAGGDGVLAESAAEDDSGVDILLSETVGPYDVVVIAASDPNDTDGLVPWLRDNNYNVSDPMVPLIDKYASQGLKLLALRLTNDAETSDIEPFSFTIPGTTPSIPLELTAIAAEPPMALLVFMLGEQRFGPTGAWGDIEIDSKDIVFTRGGTNWPDLVHRAVVENGLGFVTEVAGATEPLAGQNIDAQLEGLLEIPEEERDESISDNIEELEALSALLSGHPYLTRLYSRLPAKFMSADPIFKPVASVDVDRVKTVGEGDGGSCGAGPVCDGRFFGEGSGCFPVETENGFELPGVACVPGATARAVVSPGGVPEVVCEDQREAFILPGDPTPDGEGRLPDTCVGVDCGLGTCTTVNLTPTCVCDLGAVAINRAANFNDDDTGVYCVRPKKRVPSSFYETELSAMPFESARKDALAPGGTISGTSGGGCACDASGNRSASLVTLLLLALALFGIRRSMRRAPSRS